jgi:hypothetical protein
MSEKEQIKDKILDWMNNAEEIVQQHGGEAVDATLTVVQIEGAGAILSGVAALAICYGMFKLSLKIFPDKRVSVNDEGMRMFGIAFGTAPAGAITGIYGLVQVGNVWNYVAIFSPKLYLVHQAVSGVIN